MIAKEFLLVAGWQRYFGGMGICFIRKASVVGEWLQ